MERSKKMIEPILSEQEMIEKLDGKMNVWVNSFGGTLTKMFIKYLEDHGVKVHCPEFYNRGCHFTKPVNVPSINLGIYLYSKDIGISMTSQIHNGVHQMNYYRMKDFDNEERFSVENWINEMKKQTENWTKSNSYFPVLVINAECIWENIDQISEITGIDMSNFPEKKERKTSENHYKLIKLHQENIDKVNKYLETLPNFTYLNKL